MVDFGCPNFTTLLLGAGLYICLHFRCLRIILHYDTTFMRLPLFRDRRGIPHILNASSRLGAAYEVYPRKAYWIFPHIVILYIVRGLLTTPHGAKFILERINFGPGLSHIHSPSNLRAQLTLHRVR